MDKDLLREHSQGLIAKTGYTGYILIVQDFIRLGFPLTEIMSIQ